MAGLVSFTVKWAARKIGMVAVITLEGCFRVPASKASSIDLCLHTIRLRSVIFPLLLANTVDVGAKMKILLVLISTFLLSACTTTTPQPVTDRNSDLTHGNVQMNVQVGTTTQSDILETFGAPNITTVDGSGKEVWTYQRAAQVSQSSSSSNYWTVILAGGENTASGLETTSRMITLIIKFDENKVVSDFRSRSSNF